MPCEGQAPAVFTFDGHGHRLVLPPPSAVEQQVVPLILVGPGRTLRLRNVRVVHAASLPRCLQLGPGVRVDDRVGVIACCVCCEIVFLVLCWVLFRRKVVVRVSTGAMLDASPENHCVLLDGADPTLGAGAWDDDMRSSFRAASFTGTTGASRYIDQRR